MFKIKYFAYVIFLTQTCSCLPFDTDFSLNNIKIDDFIKVLLASKHFDELASKVADKAVEKIQNLQKTDSGVHYRTHDNNKWFEYNSDEKTKIEMKNTGDINNLNNNKDTHDSNTNTINLTTKQKSISENYTDMLIKPIQNIKLKYKHFVNKIKNDMTTTSAIENGIVGDTKVDTSIKKIKENSNKLSKSSSDSNEMDVTAEQKKYLLQKESDMDVKNVKTDQEKSDSSLSESSQELNEENYLKENYFSKEHDEKTNSERIANSIRREGDKMFAFSKSPEYAEYFDELAKLEKQTAQTLKISRLL